MNESLPTQLVSRAHGDAGQRTLAESKVLSLRQLPVLLVPSRFSLAGSCARHIP